MIKLLNTTLYIVVIIYIMLNSSIKYPPLYYNLVPTIVIPTS